MGQRSLSAQLGLLLTLKASLKLTETIYHTFLNDYLLIILNYVYLWMSPCACGHLDLLELELRSGRAQCAVNCPAISPAPP